MSNQLDFDSLPASVRTALVEARRTYKSRETRPTSQLLGTTSGGFGTFDGLMFAGLLLGPLIVVGMWIWAGGPLDAAEDLPVPLALVSLWFFSGIAYVGYDLHRTGIQAMVGGNYLYAGTLLVVDGAQVRVSELAPGVHAEKVTTTGVQTSTVYKGGRRYTLRKVVGSDYLHILGTTVGGEPVQVSLGPDKFKEEPAILERLNDRFARWAQARRMGDFQTMASLDPFTECYATQRLALSPPDPSGPRMNKVGIGPAIPFFAGAILLSAIPLIVGLALG